MKTPVMFSVLAVSHADGMGMHQPRGMILFAVLVMLVSIAIFSITGMQTIVVNQRLASNAFDVAKKDQLAESAGKFAIAQEPWIKKALINLAANGSAPLKTLSEQSPTYLLDHFARDSAKAPKVDVQLSARSFVPLGNSAGVGSGIGGRIIEVYGAASDAPVGTNVHRAKQTIVQGYLIVGAQK
jgi:hypothetical protein